MSAATVWIAPFSAALAALGGLFYMWSARRQRARFEQTVAHEKLARERDWAYRGGRRAQTRFSFVGKLATNVWEITGQRPARGEKVEQVVFTMAELATPRLRLQILGRAAFAARGGHPAADSSSDGSAPIGSTALRDRFVILTENSSGLARVLDDEVEALLMRWPQLGSSSVQPGDSLDVRWDDHGLRIAVRGMAEEAANIAHLADLGFALAGRLAAVNAAAAPPVARPPMRKPDVLERSASIGRRGLSTP